MFSSLLRAGLFAAISLLFLDLSAQDASRRPGGENIDSERINPENITIIRDRWGVPHIYGDTDAEVAYGLAWANAEDDFYTMQELLVTVQGLAGLDMGKEGAQRDFYTHAIGARKVVAERIDEFPADFVRYIKGYVQGINDFAALHPKEVRVKQSFPVTVVDVMAGYVFAMSALTGGVGAVEGVMNGKFDKQSPTYGSNAFAFNSNMTEDNGTMLAINPHQPVTGPFSWYEAHLISNEGLNIHGALFPGGTSVFLGNNENLGWAHTFNHLDLVDVFKLEMHPKKKLTYQLNDEWHTLEKRKVKLRVKLKNWLPRIGVRKTTYWSDHGAVLESKDGNFYLIKMPATERIRAGEQWYRMNKAQNFTEFYDAISLGQTTMFNIIYADRYDTVFYINNAVMPKRNPDFNYRKVIGLRTDAPLWNDFHPTEDLVQYVNPECGYVFNTNNLPTNATCKEEQYDITDWPDYFGFDKDLGDNNRAFRFMELIALPGRMDFARMKEIKYDWESKTCTKMYESIEHLIYMEFNDDPGLRELQEKIILWDGCADKTSVGAGTFLLTFQYLFEAKGYNDSNFKQELNVSEEEYIAALQKTREHLDKHFDGKLVPLGELQRHVRGNVNLPLGGYPDALAANYNEPWEDGRFKPFVGDSYVHFVHWKPGEDLPYMETLHPFGSSSREGSPHYTDQMQRYANQDPKPMTLDMKKIKAGATKIYSPGQSGK